MPLPKPDGCSSVGEGSCCCCSFATLDLKVFDNPRGAGTEDLKSDFNGCVSVKKHWEFDPIFTIQSSSKKSKMQRSNLIGAEHILSC